MIIKIQIKKKNQSESSSLDSFPFETLKYHRAELVHTKYSLNEAEETTLPEPILQLCAEQIEIPARIRIHKASLKSRGSQSYDGTTGLDKGMDSSGSG